MDNLTKWDEHNGCWLENHDSDTRKWKNGSRACMDKLAAYENTGAIPEQVQEWAKAAQEGRLVVLPIKPGTTVWALEKKADHKTLFIRERFVNSYGLSTDGYINMQLMDIRLLSGKPSPVGYASDIFLALDKIGKIVFRTREGAEAARQEGRDEK